MDEAAGLEDERQRALKLTKEVNRDILAFEANHDLMMLVVLSALPEPGGAAKTQHTGGELHGQRKGPQRRGPVLRPLKAREMGLEDPLPKPRPVSQVMEQVGGLLKQALKRNPQAGPGVPRPPAC